MTVKRALAILVPIGLSTAALAWLLHDADFAQLVDDIRQADARVLVATYGLGLMAFAAAGARTKVIGDAAGRIGTADAFRSSLVGYLGNAVLPARAGELLRLAYISKKTAIAPSSVAALVAIERLLDVVTILILAALVLPSLLALSLPLALTAGGTASFALIVGFAAIARHPERFSEAMAQVLGKVVPRWKGSLSQRFDEFARGLAVLRTTGRTFQLLAATLAYWGFTIAVMGTWTAAFGLEVPWYTPFVLCVFISLGTAIPATVTHLGTYHAAIVGALGAVGIAKSVALPVAVFAHAISFVPWPLFCIIVLGVDAVAAPRSVRNQEAECKYTA